MAYEPASMSAPETSDRSRRAARRPGSLRQRLRGALDAERLAGIAAVLAALAVFVDMAATF